MKKNPIHGHHHAGNQEKKTHGFTFAKRFLSKNFDEKMKQKQKRRGEEQTGEP